MGQRFKETEHLWRMGGLFVVGTLVFLGLKVAFTPKEFGLYGHYRPGALDDNRAFPLVHGGRASCAGAECHEKVVERRKGGKHEQIGCEACHGALGEHARKDPSAKKPERPDAATVCLGCHTSNVAKPKAPKPFPQIEPKEHMDGGPCGTCHDPHNPGKEPGK